MLFIIIAGAISWSFERQPILALSAAKAEYVAACEATMEAIGQRNILMDPAEDILRNVLNIDANVLSNTY